MTSPTKIVSVVAVTGLLLSFAKSALAIVAKAVVNLFAQIEASKALFQRLCTTFNGGNLPALNQWVERFEKFHGATHRETIASALLLRRQTSRVPQTAAPQA